MDCPPSIAFSSRSLPGLLLDLDYAEDAQAETDMNVVMDDRQRLIEIQGTAEGHPFTTDELLAMLSLARGGIGQLMEAQRAALAQ